MLKSMRCRVLLGAVTLAAALAGPAHRAAGDWVQNNCGSPCQGNSCFKEFTCSIDHCMLDLSGCSGKSHLGQSYSNYYDYGYCGDGPCPGCWCSLGSTYTTDFFGCVCDP